LVIGRRTKAYGVLAGVFLLGGVAGGATVWALSQREVRAFVAGEPSAREHRRLNALSRELDLTDQQRDKIGAILAKHREERDAAMRETFERCGDRIKAHHEKLNGEIRAELTPEQQKRYDELVREHDRMPFGPPGHRHHRP
jgi:Spy/CpxP family protein refolding chaperone